jgi:beta-xylosidase
MSRVSGLPLCVTESTTTNGTGLAVSNLVGSPKPDVWSTDTSVTGELTKNLATTYIYTASSVTGPWSIAATLNTCFYDAGLLVDDDGTMYVAYGNTKLNVAQLSSDGKSIVKTQQIYDATNTQGTLEGSRM